MKIWTQTGIDRLDKEIASLREQISDTVNSRTGLNQHASLNNEDALHQHVFFESELGLLRKQLAAKVALRNLLKAAPRPHSTAQVDIGHAVQIEYLDDTRRRKTGYVETLIIGGIEESDMESGTISCNGPLGLALYERRTNAEVDVEVNDSMYRVKILAIELPTESAPLAKQAA